MPLTLDQLEKLIGESARFAATYPAMRGNDLKPEHVEHGYGNLKGNHKFSGLSRYSAVFPWSNVMIKNIREIKFALNSHMLEFHSLNLGRDSMFHVPVSASFVVAVFGQDWDTAAMVKRYGDILTKLEQDNRTFRDFNLLSAVYSLVLAVVTIPEFTKDHCFDFIQDLAVGHAHLMDLAVDISTKKQMSYLKDGIPATASPKPIRTAKDAQAAAGAGGDGAAANAM